jgi:hypothetical protein
VCNLADTDPTMMRNRDSTHTIDTVIKTYKPMQDRRVDHLMRMQDRLTTNMMMMQDLLAAHMMRTTSLANSSSPYHLCWCASNKGFFTSRNTSASTPTTPKPLLASSSKSFSKPPQTTTQAHTPTPTASSKASSTPLKVTCFKCGVQGHQSFECKNMRVMITKDNGTVDYYSEGEYEAFV